MQPPTFSPEKKQLHEQLVDVLNKLFGVHPGFRAAHAKGVVCHGSFTPATSAAAVSRAGHFQAPVPITVRFSNATGVPTIADSDSHALTKGLAIRFHVPGAGDTDIIAHSANGFPVSTAEEFLTFLNAVAASGPDAPKPTALEQFLGTHPRTAQFLGAATPIPASFGSVSFFALHAFRFVNSSGASRYGRYFIRPVAGERHLGAAEAAGKTPDFLFDELAQRLTTAPVEFKLLLQVAQPGDPTNDASITWPDDREQIELGTLAIVSRDPNSDAEQKKLIFDPIRLIDGIELGDDPLPLDRSGVYSVSYSRRNALK